MPITQITFFKKQTKNYESISPNYEEHIHFQKLISENGKVSKTHSDRKETNILVFY